MPEGHTHSHEDEVVTHEMAGLIGTAILIGFTAMLLIDEATNALTARNSNQDNEAYL